MRSIRKQFKADGRQAKRGKPVDPEAIKRVMETLKTPDLLIEQRRRSGLREVFDR